MSARTREFKSLSRREKKGRVFAFLREHLTRREGLSLDVRRKEQRSQVLWRAIESIIPDVRDRVVMDLAGSPLTHERFLRRPRGTYGAATEDYFKDGSTPISNFVLAGDSIFPGIGKQQNAELATACFFSIFFCSLRLFTLSFKL